MGPTSGILNFVGAGAGTIFYNAGGAMGSNTITISPRLCHNAAEYLLPATLFCIVAPTTNLWLGAVSKEDSLWSTWKHADFSAPIVMTSAMEHVGYVSASVVVVWDCGADAAAVAGGDGMANEAVCVTAYSNMVPGTTFRGLGNGPVCYSSSLTNACNSTCTSNVRETYVPDHGITDGYFPPRIRGAGPDVTASVCPVMLS